MFRLQLVTGLRPGEVAALCWDGVDLDRGQLTVRRGLQMHGGRAVIVDDLKTSASYRTIGLPAVAVDVLRAQRRDIAEARLAAKSWGDDRLVFPSPTGNPAAPSNVRRDLARISLGLGLPEMRPNELRHTAATVLSDRGVPLELIADLLGHTSTRMLDATYRHRVRLSADAAVGVMGALFTRSS
jgi:integrase